MHSNSILTSDLLDIIFENRNKDYGAYVLRKNYNKRLFKSLIITLTLVVMFIFWLILAGKDVALNLTPVPLIPDPYIIPMKPIEKVIEPERHTRSQQKADGKPVIIENDKVKEAPLTNVVVFTTLTGQNITPFPETPGSNENNAPGVEFKEPVKPIAEVDKNIPVFA